MGHTCLNSYLPKTRIIDETEKFPRNRRPNWQLMSWENGRQSSTKGRIKVGSRLIIS